MALEDTEPAVAEDVGGIELGSNLDCSDVEENQVSPEAEIPDGLKVGDALSDEMHGADSSEFLRQGTMELQMTGLTDNMDRNDVDLDDSQNSQLQNSVPGASTATNASVAPTRLSGIKGATSNFVNSIVGAGIVGLPFALYHTGFFLGVFLLSFLAYLTYYSSTYLVLSGTKVKKRTFESLMEYCYGERGWHATMLSLFVVAFGAMCAYHVVIGDTIPPIIRQSTGKSDGLASRQLIVFLYSFFFMMPLSLLKNMSSLAWTSGLSVTAVFMILILVIAEAPKGDHSDRSEKFSLAKSTFLAGGATMSFAFVCQHSSFIVYNSLKNNSKKRWKRTSRYSVGFALALSLCLAVAGYLEFVTDTKGDILNNFSYKNTAINVARALLAFTMVFTYPMEQFVARHCVLQVLERFQYVTPQNELYLFYGTTLTLWILSLSVGLSTNDLGIVLSLVGSIGSSSVGYILPGLAILRVHGYHHLKDRAYQAWINQGSDANNAEMKPRDRVRAIRDFFLPCVLVGFGVLLLFGGTATEIWYYSEGKD